MVFLWILLIYGITYAAFHIFYVVYACQFYRDVLMFFRSVSICFYHRILWKSSTLFIYLLLSKSGHSSPSSYSVSHPYASAMKLSQCHPLRCPVSHDGLWCRQFPQQHFSSSFILYISFPVPQPLLSLRWNWLIEQYCICHYPCVPADGIISEC